MMDNSKIEKAKAFTSKIPMMRRAVKPSDGKKIVTSRIPMMRRAEKPSNELVANKEIEKVEDARIYSTKRSALIETGRRLTQAASQSENRKTTNINSKSAAIRQFTNSGAQNRNTKTTKSTLTNRRCTNISTKTVYKRPVTEHPIRNTDRRLTSAVVHNKSKKVTGSSLVNSRCTDISRKTISKRPTAESTNENKKVNDVKNQYNNKKSSDIVSSSMNRRLTNVSNSNHNATTQSSRNIVNRRLTNLNKIETRMPADIDSEHKRHTIKEKQQTTTCNYKETKIEKWQENLSVKFIQEDFKPFEGIKHNPSSGSLIQDQQKTSIPANDNKNLNHFSQSNIEFVADEKYRHQILSGKGLSPIKKSVNKVKCSSIYERPSLYKSSQTPFDIKTALKRLEDEGRRISMMKINSAHPDLSSPSKHERQSIFKPSQTPFDINAALKRLEEEGRRNSVMKMNAVSSSQLAIKNHQPSILKAIENVDYASENRIASAIKRNPLRVASPRLERGHIHERSASAYETVLKRLEELQLKKKIKSNKKVTFDLDTSGSSQKVCKTDRYKTGDIKNQSTTNNDENQCLTSKLVHKTPISESHSFTESPDNVKRDITTSHYNAMLLRICGHPSTTSARDKTNFPLQETTSPSKQIQSDIYSDKYLPASSAEKDIFIPSTPTLISSAKESSISALSPVEKESIAIYSAVSKPVEPDLTFKRLTNSIIPSSVLRSSLYLSKSQVVAESGLRRHTLSRLCTPKPVSFYPRTNENNEISPEFMGRRTSCIVANAPISTPMVLRNLAESFEETLSPVAQDTITAVCQRLNFDEIEKETDDDAALQDCDNSNDLQKRPVQNIFRCINIVDQLTDQECCEIFENTAFSVVFEKRLLNPIAQVLSDGDDMHFVPLKLL